VGGRSRSPRPTGARHSGQHFIRSDVVATELVRDAGVRSSDHVLEIGAGQGRLTRPLAEHAGHVTAVELDPVLAERLGRAFTGRPSVRIVHGDILDVPMPGGSWRAFGNVPFAITTPILRRLLDDPTGGPDRADLLMQLEAARKRSAPDRGTLLSMGWLPWWEFTLSRRIPRLAFDPPPPIDGGMLAVVRRTSPLLDPGDGRAFVAMLRRAFQHGSWPVRRSLGTTLPPKSWKRLARDRGLVIDAPPPSLDVRDWIAVFSHLSSRADG
jgi:23S rRNA (adenine-N6)-dimethyltransferase